MDVCVAISLTLLFLSLAEGHSDELSQEPGGNLSTGTFWQLLQQLFKLEEKVENEIQHMEGDIEELKSKVKNGPQEGLREETEAMKIEIENLFKDFERAKRISLTLETNVRKLQERNAALMEGIAALEECNSDLQESVAALQKSNSELQKADSDRLSTERVFICEHKSNIGSISCAGKPGTYLDIEFAHYGRTETGICVHPTVPSTFTGCTKGVRNTWTIVRRLCQEKTSCRLQAHNSVFGDPCVGTPKYLEVKYTCKPSG